MTRKRKIIRKKSNRPLLSINIGFLGLLTLIFITLKLLGKISWSWLWVLSPLWIGFAFSLFIMLIVFLVIFTIKRR